MNETELKAYQEKGLISELLVEKKSNKWIIEVLTVSRDHLILKRSFQTKKAVLSFLNSINIFPYVVGFTESKISFSYYMGRIV